MSQHVEPRRWNDLWAGRVGDAERAKLEAHAAACPRCAAERERVTRASDSFAPIRAESAPELGWDTIRARVHWAVSSERRANERAAARRRVFSFAAIGLASATAVVAGVAIVGALRASPDGTPRVATTTSTPDAGAPAPAPLPAAPPALAGLVDRAVGDITVDGARLADPELFARRLVAGDTIATADGRVDVQFGAASALQLGPRSKLALRRFDAGAIELDLDGTIDIVVAPRAPGQRFVVHAGDRDVEVRGTQFRVSTDHGTTRVACRHGLVAVRDAGGELAVAAERVVALPVDRAVADAHATPLPADELASLVAATPALVPAWTDRLQATTASLAIAGAHRAVRVDGIEVGVGPLRLRVTPGRHTVEAADAAGRFRRVGWVDVALDQPARLELPVEVAPTADLGPRKHQLRAGLDQGRLAACVRAIAKAGMTDTYVTIEIAVDAAGAIRFLNVLDTDLPSTTAACVRNVIADVHFGAGADVHWQEKLAL